jgi:error-prone DNA polymerase
VELRCRSAFSFLDGASNPEDLAARAAELGLPALALADRDGVYGIPRFHQAACQAGVRPLVGAELQLPGGPLLLLVESLQGYRNLCRLISIGQAAAPKGEAHFRFEDVEEHNTGLTALVRGSGALSLAFLDRMKALFPKRLWLDVSRHEDRRQEA